MVRTLLIALDYVDSSAPAGSAQVKEAIRRFQREVFLEPSGEADASLLLRIAEEVARRSHV